MNLAIDGKAKNISQTLSTATDFAIIHWYITSGGIGTEYDPGQPVFHGKTLRQLTNISNDIRTGTAAPEVVAEYVGYAESGDSINITLGDDTVIQAKIVEAAVGKGIVFMTQDIGLHQMNATYTNAGGWAASDLRQELNETSYTSKSNVVVDSTIYSTLLENAKISGDDLDPTPLTVSAVTYDSTVGTSTDKFWLPSVVEIYGPNAWQYVVDAYGWGTFNDPVRTYTGDENCTQFTYYANANCDAESAPLVWEEAADVPWWTRSSDVFQEYSNRFMLAAFVSNGAYAEEYAPNQHGVRICFAL